MEFYIDAMLGRLARFLRLLGYDSLYRRSDEDEQDFVRRAKEENRVIVTRSSNVLNKAKKQGVKAISVEGTDIVTILKSLSSSLHISLEVNPENSRCSLCNGELREIDKSEVLSIVPEGSAKYHNRFWICTKCGQVYWIGRHWNDIERKVNLARN